MKEITTLKQLKSFFGVPFRKRVQDVYENHLLFSSLMSDEVYKKDWQSICIECLFEILNMNTLEQMIFGENFTGTLSMSYGFGKWINDKGVAIQKGQYHGVDELTEALQKEISENIEQWKKEEEEKRQFQESASLPRKAY